MIKKLLMLMGFLCVMGSTAYAQDPYGSPNYFTLDGDTIKPKGGLYLPPLSFDIGSYARLDAGNTFTNGGALSFTGVTPVIGTTDARDLQFKTAGSVRTTINTNGELIVGATDNGNYALQSNGNTYVGGDVYITGAYQVDGTTVVNTEGYHVLKVVTDEGGAPNNSLYIFDDGAFTYTLRWKDPQGNIHNLLSE